MHPPSSSRCTGNENIVRTRLRCNVRNPRPEISAGRVSPFCGHRIVLCLFRDPSPEQPERFCTVRTRYRAAVALSLSLSPPSFSLFYFIALLRPRSVRRRERQKFSPIETIQRDADSRFVRRLFRLLFRLFFFYVVVTWTRDNRRPRKPTSVDPTFYFHLARKLPIGSREVGLKISSLKCF